MIWLLLAASLAASREPPVVLDPRLERFLAAPQLWHRLLQRSASESGLLCRGDGAHGRGARRRRALMLAVLKRRLYQEGPITNMRSPEELIRLYTGGDKLKVGTAMFCGTFAVHGEISYSGTFMNPVRVTVSR